MRRDAFVGLLEFILVNVSNELKHRPWRIWMGQKEGWLQMRAGLTRLFRPLPRLICDTAELFWQGPPFTALPLLPCVGMRRGRARMRFQEQAARHIDELQMLTRLQSLRIFFVLHRESSVAAASGAGLAFEMPSGAASFNVPEFIMSPEGCLCGASSICWT